MSNSNLKLFKSKTKLVRAGASLGFTLVESVVVTAVLAVLSIIMVDFFIKSIRVGNETQISSKIKQNGQAVLEMIDKRVRGADDLVCGSSDTIVVVLDGTYTFYRFKPAVTFGSRSNGKVIMGTVSATVAETACSSTDPTPNYSLTDPNLNTGVSIASNSGTPFVSVNSLAGFKEIVTFEFNVGPSLDTPSRILNKIQSETFKTSIQMR